MTKTIRWGIIGCGAVTEVKSGPALQKAKHSSLMAVMRRNGELAQDYAERHSVPRWYDYADALINDPEVDAVYIATPPDSHKHYTLKVAQAGKPVYVEKPMALNHAECLAMIEACREAGVPLFVAYYRRALPRKLKVKQLVDSGAIGEVRWTRIAYHRSPPDNLDPDNLPWRYIPEIAGGGIYADIACHMLDLLDFVLGPVRSVKGFASNQLGLYPAEDIVTGTFIHQSGVHGVGTWCFTGFERVDLIEIAGNRGKVSFACFDESPIVLETDNGLEEFAISNPPHIQQPLIQTVVDELRGVGVCPSTGESAARTNWVMDEMLKEYYG